MRKIIIISFLIPLFSYSQVGKSLYPKNIGDIAFSKETDKEDFKLCNENNIHQYFNNSDGLEYEGEKLAIEKEFSQKYKSEFIADANGLIRIRFAVNCKGETDRFRIIAMDENYAEKIFPNSIQEQLLNISKSLKGWKPKKYRGREIDYYQYLIFKLENGQLKEILP